MIVIISVEAENDLEAIGDYIAKDSPDRAIRFIRELRDNCLALAAVPHGFPIVSRYESLGIRKRTHGNYLIFYRVSSEKLTVIHVLHGARDYTETLRS